jgi:hypothetical protein
MKVGDKVIFTFLGQKKTGEIIERVNNEKWKIKSIEGTIYPFIYETPPQPTKKGESRPNIYGYILEVISK